VSVPLPASEAGLAETPDSHGGYPRLSDEQIATLSAHGGRRRAEAGEVLFHEGDERYDFYVVLEGRVAILQGGDQIDDETLIAVHGPHRFLGELSLLTGQAAFFSAVTLEPSELLVVPVERLREFAARNRLPHRWIDVEDDPAAEPMLR